MGVAIVVTALAGKAFAQTGAPQDSDARALWAEGRELMRAGETARACAKFEESLAIATLLGTRLSLANCYETLGRTASAWQTYRAAMEQAREASEPDRVELARARLAALEPRLSRLTIEDLNRSLPDLEITLDGRNVPASSLEEPIEVDPGEHVIEASAPAPFRRWETRVTVGEGQVVAVTIPPLERTTLPRPEAEPPPQPPPPPPDVGPTPLASRGHALRTAGLVAGGVGVAAVSAGIYFGMRAKNLSDRVSKTYEPEDDRAGRSAQRNMYISYAAGAAGLAAGGILFYLGSRARREGQPVVSVGLSELHLIWVY